MESRDMKLFRNISLRRKQMLIIMLTTSVALLLASLALSVYEIVNFRKTMVGNLSTLAQIVGDNTAAALDFNDPKSAEETLSALTAEPDIIGACVFDRSGKLFAQFDHPDDGLTFQPPDKPQPQGHSYHAGRLVFFKPVRLKGDFMGTVCLESDMRALYARLRQYAFLLAGALLGSLLAAFLLSDWLQHLISEPILHLVQTTRAVTRDRNYALRAQKQNEDEIGVLIDNFNEMLEQIQTRDAALQAAQSDLEKRVKVRTEELANSLSLIEATLEATTDGIAVLDLNFKVTHYNEQFLRMWRLPAEIADAGNTPQILEFVLHELKDPPAFMAKIEEVNARPEEESFDVLEFKDGRFYERWSKPQRVADECRGRVWIFRDITERMRAEKLLRQTEEVYRRAISGAGAVPYSYDYHTHAYTFMGEGIEHLIGYKREEITPALWNEITVETNMLGETAGLSKEEAARRMATGEIKRWHCDMRIKTRSGKICWISDASIQTIDESGKPVGSVGILEDITERKQSEIYALTFSRLGRELVASATPREAAEKIAEITNELFPWDACGFYLYSHNTQTLQMVLSIDTIDGVRVNMLKDDGEPGALGETDRRVIANGAELICKDPTKWESGCVPFGDKSRPSACIMRVPVRVSNRVAGVLSLHSYTPNVFTHKDMTVLQTLTDYCGAALERISAENALRKSESQFRVVWESSVDGMRLTDGEGKVVEVNDAYCRLMQKTKDELEGRPVSVAFGPEDADWSMTAVRQTLESKQAAHHESELTLWNGNKVWVEVSNSVVELPGQPPLVLGIVRDISARKQAEANLKKAHDELLTTSRMAGMAEVATSVLHNVGNVLNSVNISTNLVSEKMRNSKVASLAKAVALMHAHAADLPKFLSEDPKGRQLPAYLEKLSMHLAEEQAVVQGELVSLSVNVEHIKEIVAMQQSYAKVAGVLETMSPVSLVEDALRLNAGALERHKVRVVREFADLPPFPIEKHKVLQILVNLIRNAKYAVENNPAGEKQIIVRAALAGTEFVKISVIDNGVGIPAENLTRIFSHGFTTKKEGHGFGLHSGALAAKEMGGNLCVHSDGAGKGATFILELPINGPKRS